jgi:transcriptional regulator with XRE-family HTH domain
MCNGKHSFVPSQMPRQSNMVIKSILKKLIKEKGITITHLSRTTKVPLQTLHGWLQGSEPKSLRQVKAVADYLEVDLDYLCFGIKPLETKSRNSLQDYQEEINAGLFEVVLRRVKSN